MASSAIFDIEHCLSIFGKYCITSQRCAFSQCKTDVTILHFLVFKPRLYLFQVFLPIPKDSSGVYMWGQNYGINRKYLLEGKSAI